VTKKAIICCDASGCKNVVESRSHDWEHFWSQVWVEKDHRNYDACSPECIEKIKKSKREQGSKSKL